MTGHSYVTSWRLEGNALRVAADPACPDVPGDGTFRDLGGTVGSGPIDIWLTPDGSYLYQIYPNAAKVIGYAVQGDGVLTEVTTAHIPYNSAHSLAGRSTFVRSGVQYSAAPMLSKDLLCAR